jgi:hypothetical protein
MVTNDQNYLNLSGMSRQDRKENWPTEEKITANGANHANKCFKFVWLAWFAVKFFLNRN